MKNTRITNQYKPDSLQDIGIPSSEEEKLETPTAEPEPVPEAAAEGELVDFFITPPAIASIRGIIGWTKVLIFCMVFFSLIEVVLFTIFALNAFSRSFFSIFPLLRSAISTGFFVWLIIISVKFVRTMGKALKFNDNAMLAEAFKHQATYFKWVFLNIVVTVCFAIFQGLF